MDILVLVKWYEVLIMSDGGGESGRQYEQNKKIKSGGDNFGQALAKVAVAQVCESAGFQSFQKSALETLSDIVIRYICEVGKNACFYANLSGRTECNIFDIIQGLEDLGSSQGYLGASDINHSLADSGIVKDITQYIEYSEEIPFVHSAPHFPVSKDRKPAPSFHQSGKEPAGQSIPAWLPAFPDPNTYLDREETERNIDPSTSNVESVKQHTKGELPSLNYRQHLACNSLEAPLLVDPSEAAKAEQAAESNPFLATPLQYGEKEVSPVTFPAKLSEAVVRKCAPVNKLVENHVSAVDIFAPAIYPGNSNLDSEDGEKRILLNRRTSVKFKFSATKQSLSTVGLSLQDEVEKTVPLFDNGRDDGRDDQKRRAEKILKESMENPQELAQL